MTTLAVAAIQNWNSVRVVCLRRCGGLQIDLTAFNSLLNQTEEFNIGKITHNNCILRI